VNVKTKQAIFLIICLVLTIILFVPNVSASGNSQLRTDAGQDFNLYYATNDSFTVWSIYPVGHINFTVTSGNLNGTAKLNMDEFTGTFIIAPTTNGYLKITATSNIDVYINNALYTASFGYSSGTLFTVTWEMHTPSPSNSPIYNQGIQTYNYYYRSDPLSVNNETAYYLDQTNTASTISLTSTATGTTVYYGFRVYILHYDGTQTELTSGTPEAVITHTTSTTHQSTSTWTPSRYFLDMGYDALKIETYTKIGGNAWTLKSTHHTPQLLYTEIPQQTWTFTLYTNTTIYYYSTATYNFGSPTYPTNVELAFLTPSVFDVGRYYLGTGNVFMFILTQYTMEIGSGVYLLLVLIPTGTLYLRHRHIGPVLLLFFMFGGSGSLVWIMIPAFAAAFVDAILILGLASIVWRLLR
jgi:hypothetical protein